MLTDRQVVEITVSLIGIALVALLTGLIVYYAYLRPSFFYGDYVVLSLIDSAGKTWWVTNDAKNMALTSNQASAAVLQFANGSSGQKGQLFEGGLTSFELRHPYYGAFLTATCQSKTEDPMPGFGTNTGVQIGATGAGTALADVSTGPALLDGGQYHLSVTGFDCEASGCVLESLTSLCDVAGYYFTTDMDGSASSGLGTTLDRVLPASQQQLWTFTKVTDLESYDEYKTEVDFSFN